MSNPFDIALSEYFYNRKSEELTLHNNYGEPEFMPLEVLFRSPDEISELEYYALTLCQGHVLDIGAGVGVHSLMLQNNDIEVTALEISSMACQIMADRGVKNIIHGDLFKIATKQYDTLLLLMNGFGLSGNINRVPQFLDRLKQMLKPGGKVLLDSSDVSYIYQQKPSHYYGEVKFCYEYKHIIGEWFDWLYVDQQTLLNLLNANNWQGQIIFEDENDQYLALIQPKY